MAAEAIDLPVCALPAEVFCSHCTLRVPPGLVDEGAEHQFCCAGCRAVFQIIHESGLGAYYRHRDAVAAEPNQAKTTGKNYEEFDDEAYLGLHSRAVADGRRAAELVLEGVHCSACVWLVEKLPALLSGVIEARLDLGRAVLRVVWDPALARFSDVARTLDGLGYPPHPRHGVARIDVQRREDRDLLARMGVAGAAAGNAMLLAVALYSGVFSGMETEHVQFFRWASVVVTVPAVLWSGGVFFRGAWAALRTRTPHMDLPISLGIVAGTVSGVLNTLLSKGEIYFDSVTTLMFLLLVGRWVQRRQHRAADSTADLVQALAPSHARVLESGVAREVPAFAVRPGDLVEVRAGERVPVDGTIVEGESSLDVSLLTGEAMPETVGEGSPVHAGVVNLSSRLVVRVESAGAATRLARIVEQVEEVARERAPMVMLADRLSGYFLVVVLVLAAVTFVAWSLIEPAMALDTTVALLIITCPCALGLATPLALGAALGKAARRGILIKGGRAIEGLAGPGLVVFDKTGTLTEGRLELVAQRGDEGVASLVAAVEQGSAHPIARALGRALGPAAPARVAGFREVLGGGVSGDVGSAHVVVGSPAHIESAGSRVPDWAAAAAEEFALRAWTPVYAAVGGEVRAVYGLGDPLRPNVQASLERLRALGHRIAILSGDRQEVVDATVRRIGVPVEDARGGASPEQKLAYVKNAATQGRVFMVGDGANDAAALGAATVGIAVHGGAEASLAAADVFTTESGVEAVVHLFEGARRTMRVIRWNLGRSLVYNLVTASLAVLGLVGPLLAALLMPLSSLSVAASAYRSRTFGEPTR